MGKKGKKTNSSAGKAPSIEPSGKKEERISAVGRYMKKVLPEKTPKSDKKSKKHT